MTTINCVEFCCASAIQTNLMALGLSEVDVTGIVLAVIGMVSGWCSWWLDRRKHKQEVEGLKADNKQKEMNLSKDYVTEFRTFIAEPLQREVSELRQEIKELRYAIQRISDCPHSSNCPVRDELMRKQSDGDVGCQ